MAPLLITGINDESPNPLSYVQLPRGRFQMGGSPEDKFVSAVEQPRQWVEIDNSIAMARSPVTEGEWALFNGEQNQTPNLIPQVNVSWEDANTYLKWLSDRLNMKCRLPSEIEWEYGCRGGRDALFPSGKNVISTNDANFFYDERGNKVGPGKRTPVGTYPTNAFGLFDMVGNVCEWTNSAWHNRLHDQSPARNHDRKTIRGGGWDHLPRLLRNSWRDWAPASSRHDNLGFRVVIELDTDS